MTPAINPSTPDGSTAPGLQLTRDQVNAYRLLLRDPEARRAATAALAAIQGFASRLNAADLLRGSVVHGGDWESWLAELAAEARRNLETVRVYRASFEQERQATEGELHARDAAALELIAQRRIAATMAESKAKATKQDGLTMRKKLADAGLTPEEASDHMNQRFNGGFEEIEAGLLRQRNAHLAEAQALEDYLADPDRAASALPESLREELRILTSAMPLRATVTNRMPIAASRVW
jgi:hypothetical protein